MRKYQPCPMSERAQEQCFLVFREALNNALKHSEATRIDVSLEVGTDGDTLTPGSGVRSCPVPSRVLGQ